MTPMVTDQWVTWPDGSVSRPPIDLVNDGPEVRIEQLAPGFSRVISRPRLPIRIGHVTGDVLSAAAIRTNGEVFDPGDADAVFLNAECPDCDSALVVLPHQERGYLWYVIEHRESCPAMAQWIKDQR
jgi:hypothetical protein